MRKARNSNKSFLTGTALLGIAVIGIVFLFLMQAVNLSQTKEERLRQDVYQFVITSDFAGQDLSVWMNDSLIATHATAGDTLTHPRLDDETSLLLVDNTTQRVTALEIPSKSGLHPLHKPSTE